MRMEASNDVNGGFKRPGWSRQMSHRNHGNHRKIVTVLSHKTVTGYSCNHVTAKNGEMSIELDNKLTNNNLMMHLDIIAGLKVTWLQL